MEKISHTEVCSSYEELKFRKCLEDFFVLAFHLGVLLL